MSRFHKQLEALGYATYEEYLSSEHWADVRSRYWGSKLPKVCYVCGERRYQLHHRSYKRLGAERLNDLLPLCDECHFQTHVYLRAHFNGKGKLNIWTAAKRYKRTLTTS